MPTSQMMPMTTPASRSSDRQAATFSVNGGRQSGGGSVKADVSGSMQPSVRPSCSTMVAEASAAPNGRLAFQCST